MNPLNSACSEETRNETGPCTYHLRNAYVPSQNITKAQPDLRIYWIWGVYMFTTSTLYEAGKYYKFIQAPGSIMGSTLNGIINCSPPSPLLSQPEDVPSSLMCSADLANLTTWSTTSRECVHVIKLPANSTVEIVSIDYATHSETGISHSIHLHGYDLYMLEMGLLNTSVTTTEAIYQLMDYLESDERLEIPSYPVKKDTYPLSSGGYAVTRIFTDNPGYWFYHCHFAYHLDSGMSGILQVGEAKTFPSPPPGFPRCGSYTPEK